MRKSHVIRTITAMALVAIGVFALGCDQKPPPEQPPESPQFGVSATRPAE